jgi:hypothetical protein
MLSNPAFSLFFRGLGYKKYKSVKESVRFQNLLSQKKVSVASAADDGLRMGFFSPNPQQPMPSSMSI